MEEEFGDMDREITSDDDKWILELRDAVELKRGPSTFPLHGISYLVDLCVDVIFWSILQVWLSGQSEATKRLKGK